MASVYQLQQDLKESTFKKWWLTWLTWLLLAQFKFLLTFLYKLQQPLLSTVCPISVWPLMQGRGQDAQCLHCLRHPDLSSWWPCGNCHIAMAMPAMLPINDAIDVGLISNIKIIPFRMKPICAGCCVTAGVASVMMSQCHLSPPHRDPDTCQDWSFTSPQAALGSRIHTDGLIMSQIKVLRA